MCGTSGNVPRLLCSSWSGVRGRMTPGGHFHFHFPGNHRIPTTTVTAAHGDRCTAGIIAAAAEDVAEQPVHAIENGGNQRHTAAGTAGIRTATDRGPTGTAASVHAVPDRADRHMSIGRLSQSGCHGNQQKTANQTANYPFVHDDPELPVRNVPVFPQDVLPRRRTLCEKTSSTSSAPAPPAGTVYRTPKTPLAKSFLLRGKDNPISPH
jgi:hypothetical protein